MHTGMIELMIFDMAGTTVDEGNIVYHSLHQTFQDSGLSLEFEDILLGAAGKGKLQAIRDVVKEKLGKEDEETAQRLYRDFLKKINQAYASLRPRPFPGVEPVFSRLKEKGIQIALNTGYDRMTADGLLEKLGWKNSAYIDFLISNDDVKRGRPSPDMILLAMKLAGISNPLHVGKIGDSIVDIQEGKNAGCGLSMGITTGAHSRAHLQSAEPDHIIDQMEELIPLIEKIKAIPD